MQCWQYSIQLSRSLCLSSFIWAHISHRVVASSIVTTIRRACSSPVSCIYKSSNFCNSMKNEENNQSNLLYKKHWNRSITGALVDINTDRPSCETVALKTCAFPFDLICVFFYYVFPMLWMCLTEIHIKKPLIFVLLLVYVLIVCTCSTIFFCEAALLVFRAFCVGHAISAAAPGSTMSSCPFSYRVLFLTVPPDFQYQNEKRSAANQRFCSMKFSMYKRSLLVEQRFSF